MIVNIILCYLIVSYIIFWCSSSIIKDNYSSDKVFFVDKYHAVVPFSTIYPWDKQKSFTLNVDKLQYDDTNTAYVALLF